MAKGDGFSETLCNERHESIRHEFSLVHANLKEIRVIIYAFNVLELKFSRVE
jgi:hypothetical protein